MTSGRARRMTASTISGSRTSRGISSAPALLKPVPDTSMPSWLLPTLSNFLPINPLAPITNTLFRSVCDVCGRIMGYGSVSEVLEANSLQGGARDGGADEAAGLRRGPHGPVARRFQALHGAQVSRGRP